VEDRRFRLTIVSLATGIAVVGGCRTLVDFQQFSEDPDASSPRGTDASDALENESSADGPADGIASVDALAIDAAGQEQFMAFTNKGSQTWTVPPECTTLHAILWGAGGGDGEGKTNGGAGGYAEGYFAPPAGRNLTIVVGAAGAAGSAGTPGGGKPGPAGVNYRGGGGGGYSAIVDGAKLVAILYAGGGGGACGSNTCAGGAGGGIVGRSGMPAVLGGAGATSTAVGTGGSGSLSGNPGTEHAGGDGSGDTATSSGGGGGGGYWGGGGGAAYLLSADAGGGGGGSGFAGPSVRGATLISGNGDKAVPEFLDLRGTAGDHGHPGAVFIACIVTPG
jgi:hypothetical protein